MKRDPHAFSKWDAKRAEEQLDNQKRAYEVELRNLKRLSRKNALEFFLDKSENVISMFKEQNMHIIEEYFKLKRIETKQEIKISRMAKTLQE